MPVTLIVRLVGGFFLVWGFSLLAQSRYQLARPRALVAALSPALVVIQPVLLNAWCTLCLLSAVISLAMIGPAMDELLASLQYLRRVRDRGESVPRAFLRGPRSPAVSGRA